MKSVIHALSGALVVFALSAGAPDAWAQHHGGGGGGGARTPSGGGGGGGGTAVSRGSGGSSGGGHVSSGGGSTRPSGSGGGARTASAPPPSGGAAARPRDGGRPNYGNPVVGQAVQRPNYSGGRPGYPGYYPGYSHGYYPYYPSYYPYWGWGLGLAFTYYDPWWGYPYAYGYPGYYGAYGYPGYYGGYYGGGYGGGSSGSYDAPPAQDEGPKGGIKLKIEPENAEVFADGYYVGIVDDFNSPFQRLNLAAGKHRIEVRANGFQTLSFDVEIVPRDTISYSALLKPAR